MKLQEGIVFGRRVLERLTCTDAPILAFDGRDLILYRPGLRTVLYRYQRSASEDHWAYRLERFDRKQGWWIEDTTHIGLPSLNAALQAALVAILDVPIKG